MAEAGHRLTMEDRGKLTVTGITEVISFEDSQVVLRSSMGDLTVQGKDLRLKTLSLEGGQVAVDGCVSALVYAQPRDPAGFWRRLLG